MLTIRLRFSGPNAGLSGNYRRAIRTVEAGSPLSSSVLWRLFGSDAIGQAPGAGQRVGAALRRWLGEAELADEPVQVLVLSCGEGESARELCTELQRVPLPHPIRLLLTDADRRTAELLARDRVLRPLIRQGWVDVASFDPVRDPLVAPLTRGDNLLPGMSANPLVVITQGDLGRRPADLLRFDMGAIFEALVMLTGPQSIPDPPRPEHLHRLLLEWRWRETDSVYYRDDRVRGAVERIADELDEGAVPIPVAAVHALDRLAALAGQRMLLLAEEGGSDDLEALRVDDAPSDGLTLPTNLYALQHVLEEGGATVLTAGEQTTVLLVSLDAGKVPLEKIAGPWLGQSDGPSASDLAQLLESADDNPALLMDLDLSAPLRGRPEEIERVVRAVDRALALRERLIAASSLPDDLRAWLSSSNG